MGITLGSISNLNTSGCIVGGGTLNAPIRMTLSPTGALECRSDGLAVNFDTLQVSTSGVMDGVGSSSDPIILTLCPTGYLEARSDGLAVNFDSLSISASSPITGNGTAGNPITLVLSPTGFLEYLGDGLAVDVDTITVSTSGVISGNGTSGTPIALTLSPTGYLEQRDDGLALNIDALPTFAGTIVVSDCLAGDGSVGDPIVITLSPTGYLECLSDGLAVNFDSLTTATSSPITGDGTAGNPITLVLSSTGLLEYLGDGLAVNVDAITVSTSGTVTGTGTFSDPITVLLSPTGYLEHRDDGLAINLDTLESVFGTSVSTSFPITGDGTGGSPVSITISPTGSLEFLMDGLAVNVDSISVATSGVVSGNGTSGDPITVILSPTGYLEKRDDGLAVNIDSLEIATSGCISGTGSSQTPVNLVLSPTGYLTCRSDGLCVDVDSLTVSTSGTISGTGTFNDPVTMLLSPTGGLESRPDGLAINVDPSGGIVLGDFGLQDYDHDPHSIVVRGTGNYTTDNANVAAAVAALNAMGNGTLWIDGEVYLTTEHIFTVPVNLKGLSQTAKIIKYKVPGVSNQHNFEWIAPGTWPTAPSAGHDNCVGYRGEDYIESDTISASKGDWLLIYSYDEIIGVSPHKAPPGKQYGAEIHQVFEVHGNKYYINDRLIDNFIVGAKVVVLPNMMKNIVISDLQFKCENWENDSYGSTLILKGCESPLLKNLKFLHNSPGEIRLQYCANVIVEGLVMHNNVYDDSAYGFALYNVNGFMMSDFSITGTRHALTTISEIEDGTSRWGTPCNIVLANGIINIPSYSGLSDTRVGIDPHPEGSNMLFENIIFNVGGNSTDAISNYGATVRARHMTFDNCLFLGREWSGYGVSINASFCTIRNCTFENLRYPIAQSLSSYGTISDIQDTLIVNSTFKNCKYPPRFSTGLRTRFIGNTVISCGWDTGDSPYYPKCAVLFSDGTGHVCTDNNMVKDQNTRYQRITSGDGVLPKVGNTMIGQTSGAIGRLKYQGSATGDWSLGTGTTYIYTTVLNGQFIAGEEVVLETATGTLSNDSDGGNTYSVGIGNRVAYHDYNSILTPCDLYVANNTVGGYGTRKVGFGPLDSDSYVNTKNALYFESAYRDKNTILAPPTLVDDDSTSISVVGKDVLFLEYASGTTITALTGGIDKQVVTIITASGGVGVQHNATIQCFNNTDWYAYEPGGGAAQFEYSSGNGYWSQISEEAYS